MHKCLSLKKKNFFCLKFHRSALVYYLHSTLRSRGCVLLHLSLKHLPFSGVRPYLKNICARTLYAYDGEINKNIKAILAKL